MFFNSIKEINKLRREIHRLLSKGMSNIYLKVTIEKKWVTENFDAICLKSSSPGQIWGAPTNADITEYSKFFKQLKKQKSGNKTVCGFSVIFILKRIMAF